nr:hypothetical protein [Actibacterium lipolyticum]
MNTLTLSRPVRVAATALTLGLAAAQLAHANDTMKYLTTNPLGIAALESMDYAFNRAGLLRRRIAKQLYPVVHRGCADAQTP